MFKDRKDAGRQLGKKLLKYKGKNAIILAIPRGGVPVSYEIAKKLNIDFDVIISRKLPLPDNPEAGFGAVAENNILILNEQAKYYDKEAIDRIIKEKEEEVKKLVKRFREGRKLNLKNKIVILVDDGLAMGSTMLAAIKTVKHEKARKIVVAVPTASYDVVKMIEKKVDEVICIDKREFFLAVAEAYQVWYDLSDEEVLRYLKRYKMEKKTEKPISRFRRI